MAAGAAPTMARVTDSQAEERALAAIRESEQPQSLTYVIELVRRTFPTLPDAEVKAAVWRLHSKGLIDITTDWKFKRAG